MGAESHARGQLSEFLKQLDLEVLKQFVPCKYFTAKSGRDVLLAIQVNMFDCGGMAIGIGISHKIADGTSLITLINSWAANTRGSAEVMGPSFDIASLFPPKEFVSQYRFPVGMNIVTRRFVFDASKIALLRDRTTKGKPFLHPTRYEAISALIWQCVIKAQRAVGSAGELYLNPMNITLKGSPPSLNRTISAYHNHHNHLHYSKMRFLELYLSY
ncbi:vinorine synthase-like [Tasmannia lanceolata]|uniref:vinorine synthase-like n=1 Tax=Tasmannia lanceolata TaxID=3420 RepID=UPI00406471CB